VPVLALVGGADPQDPVTNLSDLMQHFPDSRTGVFPTSAMTSTSVAASTK
jgi:hypothetical protein